MQTFLPLPDFRLTAACLDYRRLGKQRVEARQILKFLTEGGGGGYASHPATLMWKGYEDALIAYSNTMIREWIRRGYNNTMKILPEAPSYILPIWFGNPAFHSSHRAALLHKDFTYYSKFRWTEKPELNYIWPKPCTKQS